MRHELRRCTLEVNQASRDQLAGVAKRLSGLAAYSLEFRRLSELHPSAHVTKRFPTGRMVGACGVAVYTVSSVLAQDGAKLCTRCNGWMRARVGDSP